MQKESFVLGIPYEWNVELPDYIMKHIRQYYGLSGIARISSDKYHRKIAMRSYNRLPSIR
jgi:hypothetical protein